MIISKTTTDYAPFDFGLANFNHETMIFELRPNTRLLGQSILSWWEWGGHDRSIFDDETLMEVLWGEIAIGWLFEDVPESEFPT